MMTPGGLDGNFITCICVADNTHTRVGIENPPEAPGCLACAISHDYLTGMLAVTNPNTATMMERNPGGTTDRIDQGVQDRPIANRIGAIQHTLRFAIWR